jgi:methionyl-tRNA formyltransferase
MKLVFMGTPQAAVPSLERLVADGHQISAVYTQPDRPAGRGRQLTPSPVKQAALAHGIRVLQPVKIKTEEAFDEFRSLDADAAVVVAYGRILPAQWLTAFPHGAINVHFSLLPKYRGAAPVNWAIARGESETGVTTMQMDAGLDTGNILLQRSVPIGQEENAVDLMERLAIVGAGLLSETLQELTTITRREQDDSAATFAPIIAKADGVIDWTRSAREVVDRIRAFQPFPTSFTFIDGSRLTLWKAYEEPLDRGTARAGEVIRAGGDELLVACGENAVRVVELQPEGRRRMSVRDLLNGTTVEPGAVLG